MRFPVLDDDARGLARTLYSELARGSSVEDAVHQARLALARKDRPWTVGVPVLYTSLAAPAGGFSAQSGGAQISDPRPPLDLSALPVVEGAFRGRVGELRKLGELAYRRPSPALCDDSRRRRAGQDRAGAPGRRTLCPRLAGRGVGYQSGDPARPPRLCGPAGRVRWA